jgi:glutamate carboxypeptidase
VKRIRRAIMVSSAVCVAGLLLMGHPAAFAQTAPAVGPPRALSAVEQQIAAAVDAQATDAVALLERTVNIPSATLNAVGVRRVGDIFAAELQHLGFAIRWVAMPQTMQRSGHLFAERAGTKGKRLLIIGHLDVVLEGQEFQGDGMSARGNGVIDMKGGIVVLLCALKALDRAGALDGTRLIVALTGDEEDVGRPAATSRRDLIEAAGRSDIALGFEPGQANAARVARRGQSIWTLDVKGTGGHSYEIFKAPLGNALFEASRILSAFYEELREPYLSYSPSFALGGTEVAHDVENSRGTAAGLASVVPQRAILQGDLRYVSEEQREKAKARMQVIVDRHLPGTSSSISFREEMPPMPPRPENQVLLNTYDQVSRDLGLGAVAAREPEDGGAADISFVAAFVPGLDGLGVVGKHSHAATEEIDLNSLSAQTKRAALLIYRLTRER